MVRKKVHEDRLKYIDEWQKANQDKILIRLQKGEKAKIQAFASALHTSMNQFISTAIHNYMSLVYEEIADETKVAIDTAIKAARASKDTKL